MNTPFNNNNTTSGFLSNNFDYKNLANEFCDYYYTTYDNSLSDLSDMYKYDSIFTYLGTDLKGFLKYKNRIEKFYEITKFSHTINEIISQPLNKKTILITVTGTVRINNDTNDNKFHETITLQKDNDDNYHIHNTIFNLLE